MSPCSCPRGRTSPNFPTALQFLARTLGGLRNSLERDGPTERPIANRAPRGVSLPGPRRVPVGDRARRLGRSASRSSESSSEPGRGPITPPSRAPCGRSNGSSPTCISAEPDPVRTRRPALRSVLRVHAGPRHCRRHRPDRHLVLGRPEGPVDPGRICRTSSGASGARWSSSRSPRRSVVARGALDGRLGAYGQYVRLEHADLLRRAPRIVPDGPLQFPPRDPIREPLSGGNHRLARGLPRDVRTAAGADLPPRHSVVPWTSPTRCLHGRGSALAVALGRGDVRGRLRVRRFLDQGPGRRQQRLRCSPSRSSWSCSLASRNGPRRSLPHWPNALFFGGLAGVPSRSTPPARSGCSCRSCRRRDLGPFVAPSAPVAGAVVGDPPD